MIQYGEAEHNLVMLHAESTSHEGREEHDAMISKQQEYRVVIFGRRKICLRVRYRVEMPLVRGSQLLSYCVVLSKFECSTPKG